MNYARWIIRIASGACAGLFIRGSFYGKVCLCDRPGKAQRFPTREIAEQTIEDIKIKYPAFGDLSAVDIFEAF